ncbi:thermonuclease family protein [Paracraurococcus ruber]|uniref:TNase-like domain-containing protein n=1 Tax=Paracraurococcus ruber TaxID=77675 RepID=A0ABS1CYU6_9PROT|nr:thermonuclease family protein [Paracraurococcus ruber]MBK1659708.1 hypothetical protein [Paracraurococcus ruber]TDG28589.1 hypothetical protein E2C05_20300 [Paracraurococcus ruber]
MRIRRIFRPSPAARLRLPLAAASGLGLFVLLVSAAVPRDLFGPARPLPLLATPAGEVRVLDGETLRLGERVLRLHALRVPERGAATCRDPAGRTVDCAAAAAAALASLVAGRDVACRVQGEDRHGRAIGTCEAGGVELNASLVAAGWALADGGAAPALAALEGAARQGGRGAWASAVPAPETWRRGL